MHSVFSARDRGADLLVEQSDDGAAYSSTDGGIVNCTAKEGDAVNDDGDPETAGNGFRGWYEMFTNPGANAHE